MTLFVEQSFNDGGWAGPLAKVLRDRRVLADKKIIARVWRATWKQWVQCEPLGMDGAAFWFGKPAVISSRDSLYCGYYVERGYRTHARAEFIMDDGWHWHLLMDILRQASDRGRLKDLMEQLPAERRCIWMLCGEQEDQSIPFEGEVTLETVEASIRDCDSAQWIDLILGVSFTRDQCMELQEDIVSELRAPLIRATEIEQLVLERQSSEQSFK